MKMNLVSVKKEKKKVTPELGSTIVVHPGGNDLEIIILNVRINA